MSDDSQRLPPLDVLDRILAGEASPAEREAVDTQLGPMRAADFVARIQGAGISAGANRVEIGRARLAAAIAVPGQARNLPSSRFSKRYLAIAASGLMAVACALWIVPTVYTKWDRKYAANQATQEYTTQAGERLRVTLFDGSHVTLGPKTSLQYAHSASHGDVITLNGEAYFTVIHREARPFVVRTGAIQTRVLGTAFNVKAYADERSPVEVAVADGKVAVGSAAAVPVIVVAGQMAVATDSGARTRDADVQAHIAWTDGKLVFENVRVATVLSSLGRWSSYEFRLADSALAEERISTTLTVENPDEAMVMLKSLLGVTMTVQGRIITFHTPSRAHRERRLPGSRTPDGLMRGARPAQMTVSTQQREFGR